MAGTASVDHAAEPSFDVIIIGAGMDGLALAARLPQAVQQRAAVIDRRGGWLAAWDVRRERLGAKHVRAPATLHPHPSPLALQQFAEDRGRQQELLEVPGSAPLPSTALLREFCQAKLIRQLPKGLQAVREDTVVRLEPAAQGASCAVHLSSGAVVHARAVVHTASCRRPIVPAWVRQLQPTDGSQAALPSGIATWDEVDLRHTAAQVTGRRVVLVGGGMASAMLAVGAADAGAAAVTLVARRQLLPQVFETAVGWWGNKNLNAYRQVDGLGYRIAACRQARRQATLDLPTLQRLAAAVAAGRLEVLEGCEVEAAEAAGGEGTQGRWRLRLLRRPVGGPGSQIKEPVESVPPSAFQQAVAAAAAASGDQPADGAPAPGTLAMAAADGSSLELPADVIWLACGSAYSVQADPLLAELQQQHPTAVVGGYPWVDEEHLCWPGAPVYLAGRAAMLALGPCAGELARARLAADRIAKSLKRIDFADEPVSVVRPPHLVDVTDLPSDLPRKEVQRYTFTDCDFEICVIVQASRAQQHRRTAQQCRSVAGNLDEPVPLEQVRVVYTPQSLDAWAVGRAAAYHLHLPRLWGRIIVKRCGFKVAPPRAVSGGSWGAAQQANIPGGVLWEQQQQHPQQAPQHTCECFSLQRGASAAPQQPQQQQQSQPPGPHHAAAAGAPAATAASGTVRTELAAPGSSSERAAAAVPGSSGAEPAAAVAAGAGGRQAAASGAGSPPAVLAKPQTRQLFDYLAVYDIEATCDEEKKLRPMETVDGSVLLAEALARHTAWLKERGFLAKGKSLAPVTWGDWDMKMHGECGWRKIEQPRYMQKWIDLKAVIAKHQKKRQGLHNSVVAAGLEWEGRQHCALDDARNTARLATKLMRGGLVLGITGSFTGVDSSRRLKQGTLRLGGAAASQQLAKKKAKIFDDKGKWNGKCYCGVEAKRRTVNKPGPKCGKEFYSCGRFTAVGGAQCDYFQMAN
eukprot:scaffold16.g159.t1